MSFTNKYTVQAALFFFSFFCKYNVSSMYGALLHTSFI